MAHEGPGRGERERAARPHGDETVVPGARGINDTGMSLRLASASGMPTIVIAIATAVRTWPMASQTPNRMTQMTLPINAPGRGPGAACGF